MREPKACFRLCVIFRCHGWSQAAKHFSMAPEMITTHVCAFIIKTRLTAFETLVERAAIDVYFEKLCRRFRPPRSTPSCDRSYLINAVRRFERLVLHLTPTVFVFFFLIIWKLMSSAPAVCSANRRRSNSSLSNDILNVYMAMEMLSAW